LSDYANTGPPVPQGRDDDDDDDDEDQNRPRQSFFAGGERSGISIEGPGPASRGPGGTVKDILRKAAQAPQPEPESGAGASHGRFAGSANRLGSDDVESQHIPDPIAPTETRGGGEQELAIREITFWRDGFTIHNGPLMRYDVPENAAILEAINSGNAPPSVLNVQVGQPVELRVTKRVNEDYVEQSRPLQSFSGQGNRLGSTVPIATSASQSIPGSFPSSSSEPASEPTSITTRFEVDQSLPTTSVQIRLADGTRLVCRMNLTHTVGDIRNFINASRPNANARPYTIGTTFPNRTLENDKETIKDAGLLNSVVVQRYV
jgi:UBX domain-containing protein 1